ncbi:RNA polymerase II mediator complex component Med8, putative [Cordyceps militaris CM01]|uniref:Mediator of RNA polymerase II transcription subunit 8 n=2 Tax=Cordyceps militaris TaxID=73501 RepID=G3J7S2_CORMM|nr:RNA polymerase II mediator complex component Med8, putative [Cordyceps militaris CM01]ATY62409.1 RNA polymerase II mediator complex component [Cordyceps militaris]EGX96336.1 RNA polymerase II mediator complex component Med8, putative [Cordyceps militaris CM01]
MALGLDDDELKSVEQILSRLAQLSSSIQSLKLDIIKSNPLPHPDSLHASAQILQRNLQTVLDCLAENADLFSRVAVRPSTNYPGRAHEAVLTQLLRKKLEPDVEELVTRGRETARLATPAGVAGLQALWDELRAWTQSRIADYVRDEAGGAYTKAEREMGTEGVRTGLRRDIDDDDDDEDEDDDEEEEEEEEEEDKAVVVGAGLGGDEPPAPPRGPEIETLLWFSARADFDVPRNIDYERKGAAVMRGLDGINIPPQKMEGVDFPVENMGGVHPAVKPMRR